MRKDEGHHVTCRQGTGGIEVWLYSFREKFGAGWGQVVSASSLQL